MSSEVDFWNGLASKHYASAIEPLNFDITNTRRASVLIQEGQVHATLATYAAMMMQNQLLLETARPPESKPADTS